MRLSEADCLERLGRARGGYVATTARALPVIVPVTLAVEGGELLIDALLGHHAELAADAVVALTVGSLDGAEGEGPWSVLVQGTLRAPRSPVATSSPERTSWCRAMDIELVTGWCREPGSA